MIEIDGEKAYIASGGEQEDSIEKLGFIIQYTHKSVETHPVKTIKSSVEAKQNDEHKQEVSVTEFCPQITNSRLQLLPLRMKTKIRARNVRNSLLP